MPTQHEELVSEINALEKLRLDDSYVLNDWEFEFIESMAKKLEEGRSFTNNEVAKIEELYDMFDDEGLLE